MSPKVKTILAELRTRFEALYGERLVKLVLFGSQARGDADADSDIDVLVVLKGEVNPFEEIERGSRVTADVSLEHDVAISSIYVPEERYNRGAGPLLLNVRAEGVSV
jgi:predicted nucleotidyltransferase